MRYLEKQPLAGPGFVVAKDMISSSYNQRDCVQISATLVGLLPRRLFSSIDCQACI